MYQLVKTKHRSFVFAAELEQDEDGRWSSWVDSLPGCAAWGYTEEEAARRFRGTGLAGFVHKPFRSRVLLEQLRRILERSSVIKS